MSDIPELGEAYELLHNGRKAEAVALLRVAAQQRPTDAEAVMARLRAVVDARSQGARCGCYVTKCHHDLLSEAMNHA